MTSFTENVIGIILSIPSGKVMSYGQIAREAGSPRAARQVVRILHSMSEKYRLPWHRVLNSRGGIGFQDPEMFLTQKMLLESEGIEFESGNTIHLKKYQWQPDLKDIY